MPVSHHGGCQDEAHPLGSGRARVKHLSTPVQPQARRHLDPHRFTNLTDDAKRAEGRYGRAHVVETEQRQREAEYYATHQPTVAPLPGADANLFLTSYNYTPLSREDQLPSAQQSRHRATQNSTSTSFQIAEARLRRIQRDHPEYKDLVNSVIDSERGSYSIVPAENKVSRQVAVEEYAKGSGQRMAKIEEETKYHGPPCLGSTTPAIENTVPFALDDSRPRDDTVSAPTTGMRMYPQRNRTSAPEDAAIKRCRRPLFDGPVPYDTSVASGDAYPPPPKVGVRQGLHERPTLVHIDERRRRLCSEDQDSLAMKRARGRGMAGRYHDQSHFTIGEAPSPAKDTPQSLRQRTESHWKAKERAAAERRTGRAMLPQSYTSTALW